MVINLARNPRLLRNTVRSGAYLMSFGLEGITQGGLDALNKSWMKVKDHEKLIKTLTDSGIMGSSEMILGTDSDTEQSIKATYKFLNRV